MKPALLQRFRQFADDSRGSVTVEAVLILPLLLWAYVAMFVFFDAFKTQNINLKAAHTIADMLSRQEDGVDEAYIDGLNLVYDYLNNTGGATSLRVTSMGWSDANNRYEVIWSYATHSGPVMTNAGLALVTDRLPIIPEGDSLILVETSLAYTPAFDVGITARNFPEFIATRPRFVDDVQWTGA